MTALSETAYNTKAAFGLLNLAFINNVSLVDFDIKLLLSF